MFERDIEHQLNNWAMSEQRKPLVLRGARQVGKTTVVRKFSTKFDNFLALNLEKSTALQLFESTDDVKALLPLLFLYCDVVKNEGKTLLFIDEIQNSPHTVALLRYFYEELPEIYVIAAGSLLETMLNTHISIPVGRVQYLALHPCSFVEFLNAIGEGRYVDILKNAQLSPAFHDNLMRLFNTYALIGGMPEVIAQYAENKDIVGLKSIFLSLLHSYKNDVEKYATTNTQSAVIRYILNEGWAYAGQTITLGAFAGSSYKAREMSEAFSTLQKALLLELVYPTTHTLMPATTDLKKSPKLFWLDAGLVNFAAGIQKEYLLSKNLHDTWRGMAAEQIVAQELKALSTDVDNRRNYWMRAKRGSSAEVDFVLINEGRIIPIEVKRGHNAHLKSLHQFMQETNHDLAIRIWAGDFSVDEVKTLAGKTFRLINLPFYMMAALPKLIEKY